ncbi:MAG: hypothetical protein ASARMPRED_000525 [Alectoria sarmentosa]|nr:MAG: hypothetical protein ASARMPRED_000525 [Alectoria sarmentosa]
MADREEDQQRGRQGRRRPDVSFQPHFFEPRDPLLGLVLVIVLAIRREVRGPFLALVHVIRKICRIDRDSHHLDEFSPGLLYDTRHLLPVTDRLPAVDEFSLGLLDDTRHLLPVTDRLPAVDEFSLGLLYDPKHLLPVTDRLPAVDECLLLHIKVTQVITVTLVTIVIPAARYPDPDRDPGLGAARGRHTSVGSPGRWPNRMPSSPRLLVITKNQGG